VNPSDKDKYCELCEQEPVPLFMQAWWMDAVCVNGSWEVFLYEKDGKIIAAMPFHVRKKFGLKFIIEPQLTQHSGIWIDYPVNISLRKRYELEKRVCNYFIEQLEKYGFAYYQQTFHYSFTNWQPFYWKGFKQTTRYTFMIEDIANPQDIYNNFGYGKKQHIRKAAEKLQINFTTSPEEFFAHHAQNLAAIGDKITYSKDLLVSIYETVKARNQGFIIAACDKHEIHAALFVVWDQHSAYDLLSSIHIQYRSSGASSLVVMEAIKALTDKTKIFDFEGSMLEPVAESFLQFSNRIASYNEITKSSSFFINFLMKTRHQLRF